MNKNILIYKLVVLITVGSSLSPAQSTQPAVPSGGPLPGEIQQRGRGVTVLVVLDARAKSRAVAITTDGSLIACGGEDHVLYIFDVSGRRVIAAKGHEAPISGVAFSPDGSEVASAGPQPIARSSHPVLDFVPDGEVAASGPQPMVRPTRPVLDFVPDPRGPMSLENIKFGLGLPPNGRKHPSPITLSGREQQELTHASMRGVVDIWDAKTGRLLHTWGGYDRPIDTVAYSKDNLILTTFDSSFGLYIRSATTGRPWISLSQDGMARQYGEAPSVVTSLSPAATRLVSVAHETNAQKATIKTWDAAGSRFRVLDLNGKAPSPWTVAMSPDGKQFATAGLGESLSIWDFAKGMVVRTLAAQGTGMRGTQFLAYSPDGERIVSGDQEGVVRVWALDSGRLLTTRNGPGRPVRAVAFLPSKIRIVSGGFHSLDHAKVSKEMKGKVEPLVVWDMGFE